MMKKFISIAALAVLTAPVFAQYADRYDDDARYYQQHQGEYISHDKAAEIAIQAAGGGVVTDVDFEYSQYRGARFEVEVHHNGMEHDIVIEAKSGKIRRHSVERDD